MDVAAVNSFIRSLDREIWLVTAHNGSRRGGLICTSVGFQSIVPEKPRVAISINRSNHTWDLIESSQTFALHLLGEKHLSWVWLFGLQTGWKVDKFQGLTCCEATTGCPILDGSLGWLDCQVETSVDLGDRTLYVGAVVEGASISPSPPLMSQRLFQLASPEQRAEMKRQLDRDAQHCSLAIQQWRKTHGLDVQGLP